MERFLFTTISGGLIFLFMKLHDKDIAKGNYRRD